MRRNVLYTVMIGSLVGGMMYIMPNDLGDVMVRRGKAWYFAESTEVHPATHVHQNRALRDMIVLPGDSELFMALSGQPDSDACVSDDTATDAGDAIAADESISMIEPGMSVANLIERFGQPLARSEDDRMLYFDGFATMVSEDERVSGWMVIDDALLLEAQLAMGRLVVASQDRPADIARRFAHTRQTSGSGTGQHDAFTSRIEGGLSTIRQRRAGASSRKPAWLRAFGRKLDASGRQGDQTAYRP